MRWWNVPPVQRLRDLAWFCVGTVTGMLSLVAYVRGRGKLAEVTCQRCGKCFTCHLTQLKPAIQFHEEFDCAD
jgi:hypothetical protein